MFAMNINAVNADKKFYLISPKSALNILISKALIAYMAIHLIIFF